MYYVIYIHLKLTTITVVNIVKRGCPVDHHLYGLVRDIFFFLKFGLASAYLSYLS